MNVLPKSMRFGWAVVLALEAFIIIFCNTVGLRIFMTINRFRKSDILIASLTAVDLIAGFTPLLNSMEMLYASETKYVECSRPINVAAITIFYIVNLVSLAHISAIAFERALATFFVEKHPNTKRRYFVCGIICLWLTPTIPVLYGFLSGCDAKTVKTAQYFFKFVVLTSILITSASYMAVSIKLRFLPMMFSTTASRIQARLSRTFLIITLLTVVTWTPKTVLMALRENCNSCKEAITVDMVLASDFLLYSNSIINLWAYCYRMPQFRKKMKMFFANPKFFPHNSY